MKNPEVLCIGSAVIDITAQPIDQKAVWKEKQRVSAIEIHTGGDAANQSIRLADHGCAAALVSCIGKDPNGEILKSALSARGVNVEFMVPTAECATGTALVLVDELGERRVFSVHGAHSLLSKEMLPSFFPEGCRAISLASLFSMPVLEKDGMTAYLRAAKQQEILVFADLAADKLGLGLDGIRVFLPYIDYFLPSLYDALEMTKTETAEEAAAVYQQCGAKNVIIKCGADGCYYDSTEGRGWIPAISIQPVDTTGAGDCMTALFLSRILNGDGIAAACRYACAGASYSTLFLGASGEKITQEILRQWMENQK